MNDMENVYRELHNLVRHGQKQGFVAGITISAIVLAASKAREVRRHWTTITHEPRLHTT